ncbi:Enoyl-CoA delta isomerase 1, mitochondrial [Eumeta japonica]|uniref:Enoyl-CoA delta isomerase 1, mitochondrial n=1 Tax=Eumeta variegata TaxID=151549 RepID=A0A4C1YYU6_EUMVA|nr:Enoyl-CoA delta isomerase 1, mitochondrial [Eumeta japonica]
MAVDNDGIAVVTLQRPPVNSLNLDLLQAMNNTFDDVAKNKSKGMILTSASPTVFSAGLDIMEMYKPDPKRLETFWVTLQDMWLKLFGASFPTAAAINGHAPAGGCLIATSCEYRVMLSGKFTIGLNETALGIVPPTWIQDSLRHTIPTRQAEIALTTGKMFTVDEALKWRTNRGAEGAARLGPPVLEGPQMPPRSPDQILNKTLKMCLSPKMALDTGIIKLNALNEYLVTERTTIVDNAITFGIKKCNDMDINIQKRGRRKVGLIDETAADKAEAIEKCKKFIKRFDKIPSLARGMTKQIFRQEVLQKLLTNRQADTKQFLDLVNQPKIQQSLELYLAMLKQKSQK